VQCPFHSQRGEEEIFPEGEGELRFGDQRYPIRKHDGGACPTGGPAVAHQIINTGKTTMRYLALSTLAEVEACEYRRLLRPRALLSDSCRLLRTQTASPVCAKSCCRCRTALA
jgi:uncharacterized cupin superfamily protein